jgi:hypothetical protein
MIASASTISTELDLLPLLAHCHLTRADLHGRQGLQAEANEFRNRGEMLLGQLGMKPWFPPSGGALAETA